MRVTSLASGSSGNAYLVESGTTRILLDAGLVAPVLGLVTTTYLYQGVLLGLVAASFVAMRPAKVHHLLEV